MNCTRAPPTKLVRVCPLNFNPAVCPHLGSLCSPEVRITVLDEATDAFEWRWHGHMFAMES